MMLLVGIINATDYFIFDTYNTYIIDAPTETLAAMAAGSIPNLQDIDEVKYISDSSAKH